MLDTLNTGAIPKEDIAAGYLHIAYDYAYAGSLSMCAAAAFDTRSAAKALQIGTYIDLGTQDQVSVKDDSTISFSSKNGANAAFACKIGRLEKRGKKWSFFPEEDAGDSFLSDENQREPSFLSAASSC
jgi:hypothetical protein